MVGLSGLEDWSVCTRREKQSRPACGCLYIPVASWFYLKIHICNARNQTPAHNHVRKGSTTELYSFLTLSQLPLTTLQSTSQRYSCFSNHGPAGVERGYQCCINIKKSRDAKKVIPWMKKMARGPDPVSQSLGTHKSRVLGVVKSGGEPLI